MATTISTGNGENDTITGVRIDIARLEGILTGFLTDGVRRIEQSEIDIRTQRTDMNAIDNRVTGNTSAIHDIREDVKNISDKQNSSFNRVLAVIASIVAAASMLWNVMGK